MQPAMFVMLCVFTTRLTRRPALFVMLCVFTTRLKPKPCTAQVCEDSWHAGMELHAVPITSQGTLPAYTSFEEMNNWNEHYAKVMIDSHPRAVARFKENANIDLHTSLA